MLVLSRKRDESIVIDDSIKITVLEIKGGHVKLGIEAPSEVGILRYELWAAIPGNVPTTPKGDGSTAADAA